MAPAHFVEDYERHVANLMANLPLEEAMSQAVGGGFEAVGKTERDILYYSGLRDGMSLLDFGCGSGRLAKALAESMRINYLGLDVVQSLLDYARSICPTDYRFELSQTLSIPAADASVDMVCAFSVFTHLLHAESYLYLAEMQRILKPKGRLVFSFLEFAYPVHWKVFEDTVTHQKTGSTAHLNMFIEREVIQLWCVKLGFTVNSFVDGCASPWNGESLWQSVAILEKP